MASPEDEVIIKYSLTGAEKQKLIDGILSRRCGTCREWKQASQHFHFRKVKNKSGDINLTFQGTCKLCQRNYNKSNDHAR